MITALIFLAVLAVLVLSHEFGHFIVARKCGIKVEEFGFGFPPKIFGIKRGDTVYSLNWLPLGGFVKIKGEGGEAAEDNDSFAHKKVWQKALVMVAGVTMNIIVGWLLISIGFGVGVPQFSQGDSGKGLENSRVQIMQIIPGHPAAEAGLKAGDAVIKVGPIVNPKIIELQNYINEHKNEAVAVVVERGKQTIAKNILPEFSTSTSRASIGIGIAEVGIKKYPWYSAFYHGAIFTGQTIWDIVKAFYHLIGGLFNGAGLSGEVAGPVGVAMMTGEVAKMGWIYLIQFVALLSLNLAVLNILPIPALDGGKLLFLALNKILRRQVALKYENAIHAIGFILLILLVLAITFRDVYSLIS